MKYYILLLSILPAFGAQQPADSSALIWNVVPLIFIGFLYFFIIRPQKLAEQKHESMIKSISVKNEIVTSTGVLGIITKINNNWVQLNVGNGTHFWIQKKKIQTVLPNGTFNSLN